MTFPCRVFALVAVLLAVVFAAECSSASVDAPQTIAKSGDVVWSSEVGLGGMVPVSDSVRVYFGGKRHSISAVSIATGAVLWNQTTAPPGGGPIGLTFGRGLALAAGVVAIADGYVFAFDQTTGTPRWTFKGTLGTAPGWDLLSTDGSTIYAGGPPAGRVYAIDAATGQARWEASVSTDTTQTTAFDAEVYHDTVYVGVWRQTNPLSGGLAALDGRTGAKLWHTEFVRSAPNRDGGSRGHVAFWGNLVIAPVGDGQIFGVERTTGRIVWSAPPPPEQIYAYNDDRSVAVSADVVVATSTSNTVYAYDAATGAIRWKRDLSAPSFLGVTADDSSAFVAVSSGGMYSIDARTGVPRWHWGTVVGERETVDRVAIRPGQDRDYVYVSGLAKGWKLRK